jgi:hypothetical protein
MNIDKRIDTSFEVDGNRYLIKINLKKEMSGKKNFIFSFKGEEGKTASDNIVKILSKGVDEETVKILGMPD